MKKLFSTIVLGTVLLTGCGSASAAPTETPASSESTFAASQEASVEAQPSKAAASEATSEDEKMLVLYFSGTGHTKKIADLIAENTGADEYEIIPSLPYTSEDLNYSDQNSRVVKEHEDESLQDVDFDSYEVPDWDSYTTVFVGYPIWWQDASWVMKSYVKHLDFTDKTVIPFATSASSGLGESGHHLTELAGTGDWQEGHRFSGSASEDEVKTWIDGLGL